MRIARDRDGRQKSFAFITYNHEVSVPYAINLFRGTALFHKTINLQSRGKQQLLPPPIRCESLDPSRDFLAETNVRQQFNDMTENMPHVDHVLHEQQEIQRVIVNSLQGNWSHRHHPYRNEDRRQQGRGRDNFNSQSQGSGHRSHKWRGSERRDKQNHHSRNKKKHY